MVAIHGIPNCDTVKKAIKWLDNHKIEYSFSNYRENKPSTGTLNTWAEAVGWEKLLNKRSTTFRNLTEADKSGLSQKKAVALMAREPTLIKRPVLDINGRIEVGFSEQRYQELLG